MTRDRDGDLERICQEALDRPVAERAGFLAEACAGDEELRREAEALLAHDGARESFLEIPALAVAARELGAAGPALAAGQQVGPYTIVSRLGAGGMGEVYRARDQALGRDVAIKVLPTLFTSNPDRLARFEREARLLASLNHPNIATIHGLEHADGVHALVLEVVEGETLAERLQSGARHRHGRAGLSLADALTIARQVAEALEAAHEQGVVHRDLKPANIKIRPDGVVKVLDFGLAKTLPVSVDASRLPTDMPTDAGIVVGTAAYMSPEQAKGGVVDRRSDIFAFGCVLFEMLTGRRVFDGGSAAEIMAGVIEREPDWTALPPAVDPRIQELLRRCLEKDPRKRRRDIADVRIDIEHMLSGPAAIATPVVSNVSGQRVRLAWVVAASLAVALAVAIAWPFFAVPAETPETRVDIDIPDMPEPTAFEISPEGRRLVFVAFRNGQPQLHVRSLDGTTAQPLEGTEGGRLPFWSPDGRSVGFFVPGSMKVIDLDRGVVQVVASVNPGMGGAWGPDGEILFAPTQSGPLFTVPVSGGEPVAVTTLVAGQRTHQFPAFLPGGRQFLFDVPGTPDAEGIYLGSLDSRETTRLTAADTNGVYVSPGWLLFGRQGALVARRFDPARRSLSGDPVTVDGSVAVAPVVPHVAASASTAGVIAYRTAETTESQLTWFDRSGRGHETLGEPDRAGPWNVELSHDGNKAAVERSLENRTVIRIIDSARTTLFTLEKHVERFPLWSRDDTRMAYSSSQMGSRSFAVRAPNDASSTEVLHEGLALIPCDWSPDGRFLLYFAVDGKTGPDLWVLPVDGDRKPFKFLGTASRELWGQFSPNGKWVTYQSDESGKFEIYVRPFSGQGRVLTVSTAGGIHPRWNADGTELFYVAPDGKLMAVPMAAKGITLEAGIPVPLFQTRIVGGGNNLPGFRQQYDVARDGRFLINVALESDAPPITLLFDWKPRLNSP